MTEDSTQPAPEVPPPKPIALALWLAASVIFTLIGGAVIGIAAADSESAGVTASYVVAAPVGFFWGAGVGALIGYFGLKQKLKARRAAPLGCGCGCAVFLAVGLIIFMTAIFPSL